MPKVKSKKPAGMCSNKECQRPRSGVAPMPACCHECTAYLKSYRDRPENRMKQAYASHKSDTKKRFGDAVEPCASLEAFIACCFGEDGKRVMCAWTGCEDRSSSIDRVDVGIPRYTNNCQPLCSHHNASKGNR